MEYRQLGRTDLTVSTVSFGAWAIGGAWGPVDDSASMAALHAAVDAGVNFIDTADVYGDGRSERLVARLRRERAGERIYVATKAGRRLPTQTREGYTRENLNAWVDRSLQNLETDKSTCCSSTARIRRCTTARRVRDPRQPHRAGKIRYYGVSVETVAEPSRRPPTRASSPSRSSSTCSASSPRAGSSRPRASGGWGILARVPLASGLLTGKLKPDTVFEPTITGGSIARESASTRARPSSGVPYAVGWRRSRRSARSCRRGRPEPARLALDLDVPGR
jgi:aryl-alcohol dehydrogenase-like predicted oxidoreductase